MASAEAPTFDGVPHEEAVRRARELAPVLRERAARAEALRALPQETVTDLHASGVLRILQPRRWGGMELDFVSYVDVSYELARGCASTSWNASNLLMHHWLLAMFDEAAQAEVWGANPQALIAAAIAYPQGRGRKVDGGFVVGGRWSFSSSVDIAEWNVLGVTVRDGENVVDHRLCLLHESQYEIIDDWHVMGMRATASMTVVANDVFVPEHRALCAYGIRGADDFPGARTNPNPLYRIALSAMGAHGIGGTAAGNARAALERAIELVTARSAGYTSALMRDSQLVQLRVSAAAVKIDVALAVLRNDCAEAQEIAGSNVVPDAETKLRFKRNLAYAARLCTESVDELHALACGSGTCGEQPLGRMLRDAHALAGHIMLSCDAWGCAWGLAALGGEVKNPTL